ncbi:hypothetical protein Poli38472_009909 [Pythium oligandrum]|uniref:Structure-specific endonuclease subunit SLX4 n=1 Tax=Pythium oligandrum TaxID=41045 RepID=A0A8K1FCI3_PYTOL|nr:hypothetical protein Poli38472_009909 [Pythium oligandrum]|eukprot:TMW58350.1 hypothetical protein Poli38472_009909 [Pythium oligandrum]
MAATALRCVRCDVTRGPHASETFAYCARASTHDPAASSTEVALRIGRQQRCWMRLRRDLEVSGVHAELVLKMADTADAPRVVIRDCKSTNGSKLNGEVLVSLQERVVAHQDLVLIGKSTIRVLFSCDCQKEEAPTQSIMSAVKEEIHVESTIQANVTEEVNALPDMSSVLGQANVVPQEREDSELIFETDSVKHVQSEERPKTSSSSISDCVVCGAQLDGWSVLEQQLHVNACLDGGSRTQTNPPSDSMRTNREKKPKKRKRAPSQQLTLKGQKADDETLAIAMALSKSLVDPAQQIGMDMALVSSELAEIDAQLKKLTKKRQTLVKKLEKLEKAKAKVLKPQIFAPDEAHALLDWQCALTVLFPVQRTASLERRATRRRRLVMRAWRKESVDHVSMWQRAWQTQNDKSDAELYRTQLLAMFPDEAEPEPPVPCDGLSALDTLQQFVSSNEYCDSECLTACTSRTLSPGDAVPDAVKRVFPTWYENLQFLKEQSVADLKDALDEMRRMRAERRENEVTRGHSEVDETSGTSLTQLDSHDEDVACSYFEKVMLSLIREKETLGLHADVVSIEHVDESEGNGTASLSTSVISIVDSSQEEAAKGSSNKGFVSVGQVEEGTGEMDELFTDLIRQQLKSPPIADSSTSIETPEDLQTPMNDTPIVEEASIDKPLAESAACGSVELEAQLLRALKANVHLYEAVLLLQPVELQQLHHYITIEMGIRCAKTVLLQFCDRHGITFKS